MISNQKSQNLLYLPYFMMPGVELRVAQLDDDGKLGPITEPCIIRAERTFFARAVTDTNPTIVQMKLRGSLLDHWYYRSKEWIDQPYFAAAIFLQPYVGPTTRAMRTLYGEETFIVDEQATEDAKFLLENPEFRI